MGRDDFLTELARIIPPERLLTKPAQLVPFESDALTAFRKRPLAVVMVESLMRKDTEQKLGELRRHHELILSSTSKRHPEN